MIINEALPEVSAEYYSRVDFSFWDQSLSILRSIFQNNNAPSSNLRTKTEKNICHLIHKSTCITQWLTKYGSLNTQISEKEIHWIKFIAGCWCSNERFVSNWWTHLIIKCTTGFECYTITLLINTQKLFVVPLTMARSSSPTTPKITHTHTQKYARTHQGLYSFMAPH